jgi:Putative adhesin
MKPLASGPMTPGAMTPGRVVALLVGVPVALCLIGWTGFSFVGLVGRGSYPVSYSVPVQREKVIANISGGNVTLRQVPGIHTSELAGTVEYSLFRPVLTGNVTSAADDLQLTCSVPVGWCGMNPTLTVPDGVAVSLNTAGGDLGVADFTGDLTVSAGGGNLNASNLAGTLDVATGGGDLNATGLAGNVTITAAGGNVILGDVAAPDVNIQSGGGDVTLTFSQVPHDLSINADGGNVEVIVPQGSTHYDLSYSTDGGNYSNNGLPTSGSATDMITVDSGGGDITLSEGS